MFCREPAEKRGPSPFSHLYFLEIGFPLWSRRFLPSTLPKHGLWAQRETTSLCSSLCIYHSTAEAIHNPSLMPLPAHPTLYPVSFLCLCIWNHVKHKHFKMESESLHLQSESHTCRAPWMVLALSCPNNENDKRVKADVWKRLYTIPNKWDHCGLGRFPCAFPAQV